MTYDGDLRPLLPDDPRTVGSDGDMPGVWGATESVAARFDAFTQAARDRITGIGAQQYAVGEGHRYQRIPLEQLVTELQEELMDVAAYSFFLHERLDAIRAGLLRVSYGSA